MHRRRDFKTGDPSWDALEAQWMRQMADGGEAAHVALASLFGVYGKLFVDRLRFYGLGPEEAEEVAQDLWMEVARAAPRYRTDAPVRFFLLGFLKTARLRYFSDRAKLPPLASIDDEAVNETLESTMQSLSTAALGDWADFDFLRCVRLAFARFEQKHPRLASLLLLKHVEEMSLEEIAADLGSQPEEVKAQVFSARNKFRPDMGPCLGLWPHLGTMKR